MSNKPTKAEILANIAWIYNGNHYENREDIGIAIDGYFTTHNMIGEVIEPIDYHRNVEIDFWRAKDSFTKQFEKNPGQFWKKYFYEYEASGIKSAFDSTSYKTSVFRGTYSTFGMFKKILDLGFEPYDIFSETCRIENHQSSYCRDPRQHYIGMLKHCKTGQFVGCAVPAYMFLNELYEKYYFHLKAEPQGFVGSDSQFGFQAALNVNGISYAPDVLLPPVSKTKVIDEAKPLPKPKKQIDDNQPDLFGEVA